METLKNREKRDYTEEEIRLGQPNIESITYSIYQMRKQIIGDGLQAV